MSLLLPLSRDSGGVISTVSYAPTNPKGPRAQGRKVGLQPLQPSGGLHLQFQGSQQEHGTLPFPTWARSSGARCRSWLTRYGDVLASATTENRTERHWVDANHGNPRKSAKTRNFNAVHIEEYMQFMDKINPPKGLVLPAITKPPKCPARPGPATVVLGVLDSWPRTQPHPFLPVSPQPYLPATHLPCLPLFQTCSKPRFFSDTPPDPHCRSPDPVAAGAKTRTPRAAAPSTSCESWRPWAMAVKGCHGLGACDRDPRGAERPSAGPNAGPPSAWSGCNAGRNWERQLRNKKC